MSIQFRNGVRVVPQAGGLILAHDECVIVMIRKMKLR